MGADLRRGPGRRGGSRRSAEAFQTHYHPGASGSMSETALEQGDDELDADEDGQEPRAGGLKARRAAGGDREEAPMSGFSIVTRRRGAELHGSSTRASARCISSPTPADADAGRRSPGARCPPDTGGKGSYGHRHKHPGGDLLRASRGSVFVQARRRRVRGRAAHARARRRPRSTAPSTTTDPRRSELVICSPKARRPRGRARDHRRTSGPPTERDAAAAGQARGDVDDETPRRGLSTPATRQQLEPVPLRSAQ